MPYSPSLTQETFSVEQKLLVQASFRQVIPISDTVVRAFYDRLFALDPSIRGMFKSSIAIQGPKLVAMLVIAMKGLDRLDELVPALQGLARQHISYGVKREHYAVVGEALLWTLDKFLGSAFTLNVKTAWAAIYGTIAAICIEAAYDSE